MAGMGPPPKSPEQRKRRNATFAMTALPMEGRQGDPPGWPLLPDVGLKVRAEIFAGKVEQLREDINVRQGMGKDTGALERRLDRALEQAMVCEAQLRESGAMEQSLWAELWRLPQAVAWERLMWTRDVAQYVRYKVLAELGDLNSGKEARQYSDRLGLTPLAMLRLRWAVSEDETAARREDRAAVAKRGRAADPYAALRAV